MNIDNIIFGIFMLLAFYLGTRVGNSKNTTLNPVKIIKENKINKEKELKNRQTEIMLSNIDNYDGTGLGQKEIPRD